MTKGIGSTGVRMVAVVAAAAFVAGTAPGTGTAVASDNPEVEWNYSIWGNPRAFTKGIEAIKEYVEEQSGGNFRIEIHYGETISPARENLDGLNINAFESAHICTSYHPGRNPVGSVLDLPFLPFEDLDVMIETHDAFMTYEPWVEEMERWSALPWYSGILPQYEFMGRGDPPETMEDWEGMRVRALGGLGEAMRKLGAVPTTVPAPEVYTALERRVVQAASWPYSYAFGAFRAHEISDWYTEGLQIGAVFCPSLINIDAWNDLPGEYQALVMDSKEVAYDAFRTAYTEADEHWIPIYEEMMTRVTFTPEEIAEFREVAGEPVWQEWVERHQDRFDSRAVLDFVLETARQAQDGPSG